MAVRGRSLLAARCFDNLRNAPSRLVLTTLVPAIEDKTPDLPTSGRTGATETILLTVSSFKHSHSPVPAAMSRDQATPECSGGRAAFVHVAPWFTGSSVLRRSTAQHTPPGWVKGSYCHLL